VKDYLITNGIAANRVATISYGEELPVCHDESESCWARNRRVHFVILGQ
jgi:peptidoglycan-associated lipoprotein